MQEDALVFLGATVSLRHPAPLVAPALAMVPFLLVARPATSARIATRAMYLQSVRIPTATVTTIAPTVSFAVAVALATQTPHARNTVFQVAKWEDYSSSSYKKWLFSLIE